MGSYVEEIKNYTPYLLSSMAETASPDSQTSVGAVFLAYVRDWYAEHRQEIHASAYAEDEVRNAGTLDSNGGGDVSHRTEAQWAAFTDLALYYEELESLGGVDVSDLAAFALGQVAERLARALYEADDTSDLDHEEENGEVLS